jgi:basic membrane lipoprotein Med (substrate-binding protein (PBP1-ABC) superfamily)
MAVEHRSLRSSFLFFTTLALCGTLSLFLGACNSNKEVLDVTPTEELASTSIVKSTPTLFSTYTPSPSHVILLVSQETNTELLSSLEATIDELATEAGYVLDTRTSLSADEIDSSVQLVVGLPPDLGLEALAASSKQVQFLGVGLPGLSPTDNLSVIGPMGFRTDHLGFLAGYLAAVMTPDWRVGVIGRSDTSAGLAAMNGFVNGAGYFCGTCRPVYPPYVQYPIQVGLSQYEIENGWQSAVDILTQASVETVYVTSEINNQQLLSTLTESGMVLIGGNTPAAELRANWVATLRPDPGSAVRNLWTDLQKGQGGASVSMPILITDVNPDFLSPGRQRLVEAILLELMEGFIDTGVDPLTGNMY